MDAFANTARTVFVIDDDEDLLRALRFSLELEGFAVETRASGAGLHLADLPAHHACLVIDYVLPDEENGLALLQRLRREGVQLPAIMITTHAGKALRNTADALGAGIVEKPLLGPELVAEINARTPR